MSRFPQLGLSLLLVAAVGGCANNEYSPNTYSVAAVQQANKVESGTIVGFRQVSISANGTVGAVTGGAAGGILGSQASSSGMGSALASVGGSVVGSLVGNTFEHVTGDTTGWEYIVRKQNGDLLSVTQKEPTPLPLGQKVLVITGAQARIVPDYSVQPEPPPSPAAAADQQKAVIKDQTAIQEPPRVTTETLAPPASAPDSEPASPDMPPPASGNDNGLSI